MSKLHSAKFKAKLKTKLWRKKCMQLKLLKKQINELNLRYIKDISYLSNQLNIANKKIINFFNDDGMGKDESEISNREDDRVDENRKDNDRVDDNNSLDEKIESYRFFVNELKQFCSSFKK
jgi:hypothetical protein